MTDRKALFYAIAIGINISALWKHIIVNWVNLSEYGFGVVFSQICELVIPAISLIGLLLCLWKKESAIKQVIISICVIGIMFSLTLAVWGRYWKSPIFSMIFICIINIAAVSLTNIDPSGVKKHFSFTLLLILNICHFLWFFDLLIANSNLFFRNTVHTATSISVVLSMIFFVAVIAHEKFFSKEKFNFFAKDFSRSDLIKFMMAFSILGLVCFCAAGIDNDFRFNLWFISIVPANIVFSNKSSMLNSLKSRASFQ